MQIIQLSKIWSGKVAQKYSAFSYKKGNSFLHRCPAWAKLIFIPVINILFLYLPVEFTAGLILVQFCAALYLKFSVREQLKDFTPVIFYAVLLFFTQILTCLFSSEKNFLQTFSFENQKETIFLLLKLFCIMQSASLVFKTSTSLELREGIFKIENLVRKILHLKNKATFTDTISMFLNFIPLVSKIWEQSKKAWLARGGKNFVKMYLALLPVLFSVGIKKAYNMSRAIAIRQIKENTEAR